MNKKFIKKKIRRLLKIYKNIFDFSFNFKKLKLIDDDGLQNECLNLEGFLKNDLDGLDLFSKLKVLKEILQIEESAPIDILNYVKRLDSFLNSCIAYRILLTIPVIVASTEKSFLKLKLIDKILPKINNVTSEIKWISHIIN